MIEGAGCYGLQRRCRRASDEPVEQHRHTAEPRGDDGAGHGGEFAPAQASQNFQAVAGGLTGVEPDGLGDDADLGVECRAGDTGAGAGPVLGTATVNP